MTELPGSNDMFLRYQKRFSDIAHEEAVPLQMEWLSEKYNRLATRDIQNLLDEATAVKMQYAATFNHLATLHGVGVRDCEAAPVESPVVHLANILDGESIVLSGREVPKAMGVAPLTAKLSAYEPHARFSEQAFGHVCADITDPNTNKTFREVSYLENSWLEPGKIYRGCDEDEVLRRAQSLRTEIIRDCSLKEYIEGCSPGESMKGIYESTSRNYYDLLEYLPNLRRVNSTKGTQLIDAVSDYVAFLTDQTALLQSNVDLLEWLLDCARNPALNPLIVERTEGAATPVSSVEPDTYTVIPRGNDTSTVRINPIKLPM